MIASQLLINLINLSRLQLPSRLAKSLYFVICIQKILRSVSENPDPFPDGVKGEIKSLKRLMRHGNG